jgi:hypothetical protein
MYAISYFLDPELAVEIDQINWKLHEKGVDSLTRHYPHSFSMREPFAA